MVFLEILPRPGELLSKAMTQETSDARSLGSPEDLDDPYDMVMDQYLYIAFLGG